MNIEGLVFTKKPKKAGRSISKNIDVSLSLQNEKKIVAISFSKDVYCIMNKPDALVAAYVPVKIYFMESSIYTGYKALLKDNYDRAIFRFPAFQLKIGYDCIGFYDLKWDASRELFYINLMEKKSGI